MVKTDGESSIVALRDAVARYHGGIVTPEVPPTGESQAHGSAEDKRPTDAKFDQSIFGSIGRASQCETAVNRCYTDMVDKMGFDGLQQVQAWPRW